MTMRTHTTILCTALIVVLASAAIAQAGKYTTHNCPASLQSNFNAGPWQSYGGSLPSVGGFQGSCTPGSTLGTAIGWYATAQALNSNLGVVLQSPSGITIRENAIGVVGVASKQRLRHVRRDRLKHGL